MYLCLREILMLEFVLILGATASCSTWWCFTLFRSDVYILLPNMQFVTLCAIVLKPLHWGTCSDFALECFVLDSIMITVCPLTEETAWTIARKIFFNPKILIKRKEITGIVD